MLLTPIFNFFGLIRAFGLIGADFRTWADFTVIKVQMIKNKYITELKNLKKIYNAIK
jgi:hypothetical protein